MWNGREQLREVSEASGITNALLGEQPWHTPLTENQGAVETLFLFLSGFSHHVHTSGVLFTYPVGRKDAGKLEKKILESLNTPMGITCSNGCI